MAAGHIQHKIRYPPREVVRADGKFPYRPDIVSGPYLHFSRGDQALAHALARPYQVSPRPLRKYQAQIGLKNMEMQAARTASEPQHLIAKWRLEALVSRARSHFAHRDGLSAVANLRSPMVGTMSRRSACLLTDNYKQTYRDDLWAPTAQQPLLPDRDAVATMKHAGLVSGRLWKTRSKRNSHGGMVFVRVPAHLSGGLSYLTYRPPLDSRYWVQETSAFYRGMRFNTISSSLD